MSLIAWWPLTGDTNNYGTLGAELQATASSTTFVDGKIGQALYKGSLTITGEQWKKIIGNTISIAMWIYTRDDGSYSAGTPFFGMGGMTAPNNRKFSMFHYDKKTNLHCSWQNDNSNGTYWSCHYSNFFELNKWVHLCVVQDAATDTITVYRNGEQYSESTVTGLSLMNFKEAGTAPIRANIDYQHMNDIRIYDHALSRAEVKELSKSLVVHYTFDDVLAEPTINIDPCKDSLTTQNFPNTSFGAISRTYGNFYGFDCVEMHLNTTYSSDVWLYMNSNPITQGAKVGDTVTRSCWMYIPSGQTKPPHFTESIEGNSGGKKFVQYDFNKCDTWQRISMTGTIADTGTNNYLHYFMAGSGAINFKWYMRDFQMEIKDHATPYTPTSRESMLVNEAGYSGNGTLYNSSLSTDTASGAWSCHTPRINPDSINTMVSTTNAAYVYADVFGYNHTPTEFTVAWWWKVIDWGYGTGPFGLVTSNGNYMDSTLGVHDGAVYVNFAGGNTRVSRGFTGGGTGKWTHFALTFKPGSYTSYINGVSQGTATTDASLTLDPWRYIYLGAGCAGGCLRDGDIYWGDFRYYNTCLSASDIVELYKTKAYITDQGDIEAHQFIEGKTQAQVTSRYSFEADEFYEELYDGYDVLEYIESTGTQYVDTGYIATSTDYTYELDMAPTKIGGFYSYIGFMASGTTPRAGIHEYSNTFMIGANATTNSSVTPVVNERMVLKSHCKSGAQKLYKNNVQIASNTITFNHSSNTLTTHIFGRNYSSGRNLSSIKLYEAKIYEGSTLVRHYIPVRRQSDNAFGLYELLNGTFHANSGSGTFVSGPAITNKSASIYEDMHVSGRELIEI